MVGWWFSPGIPGIPGTPDTPGSSTNKMNHHDITEIQLKVALTHVYLYIERAAWEA